MHLKPTPECQIWTLIFEKKMWRGLLYKYPMKICRRTTKFFPTYVKGIARAYNWLKCVGEIMHLKSTAGCQISSLIFGFSGGPFKYLFKNCRGTAKFFPTWVYIKGISRTFKWHKCLGGFMHLKPTAGCQISTLIFGFKGGAINIPWKIAEGGRVLSHLGL